MTDRIGRTTMNTHQANHEPLLKHCACAGKVSSWKQPMLEVISQLTRNYTDEQLVEFRLECKRLLEAERVVQKVVAAYSDLVDAKQPTNHSDVFFQ